MCHRGSANALDVLHVQEWRMSWRVILAELSGRLKFCCCDKDVKCFGLASPQNKKLNACSVMFISEARRIESHCSVRARI